MIGPPEQNDPDGALCNARHFAILAIDQSSDSSGWATRFPPYSRQTTRVDVAKDAVRRRDVVQRFMLAATQLDVPMVAVLEDHRSFAFSRGNMSVSSAMGMGAARGRWEQELEAAGIRDVHLVEPRVWRKAVLGLGNAKTEAAKAAARLHARAVLGCDVGADESEALCMALWAERALMVRAVRGGGVRVERISEPARGPRGRRRSTVPTFAERGRAVR